MFRVDYTLEQAGGKEFGTVFINEKENVAATLLAAGWAKVRAAKRYEVPDCYGPWFAAWAQRLPHQGCGSSRAELACPGCFFSCKCVPFAGACESPVHQSPLHTACTPLQAQVRTPGGSQSPFYDDLAKV